MDFLSAILLIVALVCLIIFLLIRKPDTRRLPPLAPGLPIIGNLLTPIPKNYQTYVDGLALGDVYQVNLGLFKFLILNSHRAVHEAFVGQADVFTGRQKEEFVNMIFLESGVVNTDGAVWQEHRRLMLRLLREFGLGRSVMTDLVNEEVAAMIDFLDANAGTPMITQEVFSSATNNVISRLIFGERSGSDDENFKEFSKRLAEVLKFKAINILAMVFPIVVRYPFGRRIFSHFSGILEDQGFMQNYIHEKVKHQQRLLDAMDPPLCEIDQASNICEAFLIEKARQARTKSLHSFSDTQIMQNLLDLFSAGTETTASTLNWTILLLAVNPGVQDRVRRQIAEVIGLEKTPSASDRQALPLVCALMDEAMRYASLVPTNLVHRTTEDTVLLGYDIPADTLVQCNLYGIHHDPKTWERPDDFHLEHFLSADGEYRPSKFLIPFSLGKRACLGESLARTEYFVALVAVMQKFRVELADPNVDVKEILEGTMGVIRHPLPHQIVFSRTTSG